ncbi:hypothetical protein SDC9_62428 [bioreactor metagenome]|uniref:Uncharacterized protein n=1 Tax=bioreactor metagenome TaxID=1076179 RepID=A0A644XPN3_9ZZZZ
MFIIPMVLPIPINMENAAVRTSMWLMNEKHKKPIVIEPNVMFHARCIAFCVRL